MSSAFAPFEKAPVLAPPKPAEAPRGIGVFDVPGNLLYDITQAAVGMPMGMIQLFQHPVETTELMARQFWHDWSPLFAGRPGEWLHNTMAHPLGPLLDIAAFATGGGTLAAKGATKLAKQGTTVTRIEKAPIGVDVGKNLDESFSLDDFIEGLDRPEIPIGVDRVTTEFIPRFGPDSWVKKFADFSGNKEIVRDPMTGKFQPAGQLQYHDRVGTRPTQFKQLKKNAPVQKWVAQKQHQISVQLSKDMPNLFGPKDLNMGIMGLRTIGQQARYERHHLRSIARNHTALYAFMGKSVWSGKVLDEMDEAGTKEFFTGELKKIQSNADQHARTWEAGKPLPVDAVGDKAYSYLRDPKYIDFTELPRGWTGDAADTIKHNYDNLEKTLTTQDLSKAQRVPGTNKVKIVPSHTMRALGIEGGNSAKFLQLLYRSPTQVWKTLMLGYAPRFFVNNAVGNMFLYLLSQGGGHAIRGLVDGYRQVYKEDRLAKTMTAVERGQRRTYIDNHFADHQQGVIQSSDLQDTFVRQAIEAERAKKLAKQPGNPPKKPLMEKAAEGLRDSKINLFHVTHKYADRFIRESAISAKTRSIPEVMEAAKRLREQGLTADEAFMRAADEFYAKNRRERDRVSQETFDIMGDYATLGPTERLIREFVPFYSWDRHILNTTKSLARDRPVLLASLTKLGVIGTEETERMLGIMLPDFLKGAIPFGGDDGRQKILTTQGMNPFATIPDIGNAAWAFALPGNKKVSSTLGSQINPILQGGIEAMTGTSLLTGEPKRGSGNLGFLGGTVENVMTNFPQYTLIKRALTDQEEPKDPMKPFLYSKSESEAMFGWLGFPIKWLDVKRAEALAKQQQTQEGG